MNTTIATGNLVFRAFAALLAALVIGTASLSASAASTDTTGTVVAIDWKSLDRNQKYAEVWVTQTFPRTITLGHGLYPHRSQRLHYIIACEERTFAVSQWLLTDDGAGSGQVVWSGQNAAPHFSAPWAGSAEAQLVVEACERKQGSDTAALDR